MTRGLGKYYTWKEYLGTMITIALPVAMQNLLSTTASMVDTIMLGNKGELAVAAVGICSQISSLYFASYWGFASGSMLFFAQFAGAKDEKGVNRTFGISLIFMTLVAAFFSLVCIIKPEFFLSVYTDKQAIIEAGAPYIRIVGFAYPFQVYAVLISNFLRSTERVKAPLVCSIVALVVNFVLNYIFINGKLGMPEMGVAGAAIGTLASGIVNVTLLLIFLFRSKCDINLHIKQIFAFDKPFLKSYLAKSLPILCNEMLYGVGQMIINIVIGHQSEQAIAAMAAFRVCEGFVYAFFGGLASAVNVIVGREVGSGHPARGFVFCRKSALFCPAVTFLIVLVCTLLNRPLLGLFGLSETALMYGKYMLMIYLVFGAVRTANYIMNEAFRAGGEAIFGTVLEIGGLFLVSVPATWIAGMTIGLPFLIVFSFVYTDEIIRLVAELIYVRTGKWIKPVTTKGREALPEFMRELRHGKKQKISGA